MSVAATTRVEKLQYKEILTPRSEAQTLSYQLHQLSKICFLFKQYFALCFFNCSWREVDIFAKPIAEEDDAVEVWLWIFGCFWGV